jgi:putative NADH-flavin reductase
MVPGFAELYVTPRPAALTQGERTGTYRHGFAGTAKDLTLAISTADVADFMVQQVEDTTYRCGTPGLSY